MHAVVAADSACLPAFSATDSACLSHSLGASWAKDPVVTNSESAKNTTGTLLNRFISFSPRFRTHVRPRPRSPRIGPGAVGLESALYDGRPRQSRPRAWERLHEHPNCKAGATDCSSQSVDKYGRCTRTSAGRARARPGGVGTRRPPFCRCAVVVRVSTPIAATPTRRGTSRSLLDASAWLGPQTSGPCRAPTTRSASTGSEPDTEVVFAR